MQLFYEEIIVALSEYNLKVLKYSRLNSRLYINRLKKIADRRLTRFRRQRPFNNNYQNKYRNKYHIKYQRS